MGILLPSYSDLVWNYKISSPGVPACWLQILRLVNFHNHVSQILIINNFSYINILINYMTIYRYVSSGFCFSEEHKQMCVNFSSILHFLNLIFKSSWRFCWKEKIKLPLLFFFSLSGCPFSSLILLNTAQLFFNLCHHCVRHWPLFLPLPIVIQGTLIIFSKHLGFLWPLPSGKFLPSWLLTKRMPQLLISPKSNPFLTCFFGIFIPYLLLRCPISEISSTYSLY